MNPLQELVIDVLLGQSLGEKTCFTDDFIVLERLRSMIVLESCIAHDSLIPPGAVSELLSFSFQAASALTQTDQASSPCIGMLSLPVFGRIISTITPFIESSRGATNCSHNDSTKRWG
jgi:hypothetical protein